MAPLPPERPARICFGPSGPRPGLPSGGALVDAPYRRSGGGGAASTASRGALMGPPSTPWLDGRVMACSAVGQTRFPTFAHRRRTGRSLGPLGNSVFRAVPVPVPSRAIDVRERWCASGRARERWQMSRRPEVGCPERRSPPAAVLDPSVASDVCHRRRRPPREGPTATDGGCRAAFVSRSHLLFLSQVLEAGAGLDRAPADAHAPVKRFAVGLALACVVNNAAAAHPALAMDTSGQTAWGGVQQRTRSRVVVDPRDGGAGASAETIEDFDGTRYEVGENAFKLINLYSFDAPSRDAGGEAGGEATPSSGAGSGGKDVSVGVQIGEAVEALIKPLLSEFGAAVLGFSAGAVFVGFFMGWQQSKRGKQNKRASSRQALADLSMLDEAEIQELIGELPAWLAFRDVERSGWLNKVLSAAWPYLDQATSNIIVEVLDPILQATRPSFLTTLSFERFTFGDIPARIEGVKVYETSGDGSVEIDLNVFWAGDPDVVLGVRAAQDQLSVPVSLTEFECTFTLRLIFAPLLGVFPCFGALTIALMDEPQLDFDLRVVGGDVTLVPGLKVPLKTYIKALIASWMVWPRCITVAIPGTGYTLPSEDEKDKPATGLLHIQVIGHDGRAVNPSEVGLQVRWPVADLLVTNNQAEERVKALPGGGMLSSKEITLPVEDPRAQLLCVRWYTRAVVDEDTGFIIRPEQLDGEASVVLNELMRQAIEAGAGTQRPKVDGENEDEEGVEMDIVEWGPVPVAAELEPPVGADIKSIGGKREGGKRNIFGGILRGAGAVGAVITNSASGVRAGYRAVRSDGWSGVRGVPGAVVSGYKEAGNKKAVGGMIDQGTAVDGNAAGASGANKDVPVPTARLVRLRVRYQPLDDVLLTRDEGDSRDSIDDGKMARPEGDLIHGRYASTNGRRYKSGSSYSSSFDWDSEREDEISKLRQILNEREKEILTMRTERSLLEKELQSAAARERVNAADAMPALSTGPVIGAKNGTNNVSRLEMLQLAANQTIEAIKAARSLPPSQKQELGTVLQHADLLVTKAATVVQDAATRNEEAAEVAATEAELLQLKAVIASAKARERDREAQAKEDKLMMVKEEEGNVVEGEEELVDEADESVSVVVADELESAGKAEHAEDRTVDTVLELDVESDVNHHPPEVVSSLEAPLSSEASEGSDRKNMGGKEDASR